MDIRTQKIVNGQATISPTVPIHTRSEMLDTATHDTAIAEGTADTTLRSAQIKRPKPYKKIYAKKRSRDYRGDNNYNELAEILDIVHNQQGDTLKVFDDKPIDDLVAELDFDFTT